MPLFFAISLNLFNDKLVVIIPATDKKNPFRNYFVLGASWMAPSWMVTSLMPLFFVISLNLFNDELIIIILATDKKKPFRNYFVLGASWMAASCRGASWMTAS